jgi:hypothetical protein
MSAIITTKFRYQTAVNLINAIGGNGSQTTDKYYLFIGRTEAWEDDENPPTPEDSVYQENDARFNMLSLKLITAPKISHVIPRYNWTSGQTYAEYDDQDELLTTKRYFVYTEDDLSVYKCIKAGSGPSVVRPSGISTSIGAVESDGYQWKYMYTLTGSDIGTFTTSTFIPVKTLATDDLTYQWDVQQAAIDGGIHRIKVTNGGTGYQSKPTVAIVGNGSGCTVQASGITIVGGVITEILVTNPGSGYSQAEITFTGGGPTSAATARAVISPSGGHGSDPIQELGGYYAMIASTLSGAEGTGDFLVDSGFRQIGILRNPVDTMTDEIAEGTTYIACTKLIFSNLTGGSFAVGDTVVGATSNATAIVDSVIDSSTIAVHQNIGTGFTPFQSSETIEVGSVSATVDMVIEPEVDVRTGQLLYIENISPVTRNVNQTEDIRLVLEL